MDNFVLQFSKGKFKIFNSTAMKQGLSMGTKCFLFTYVLKFSIS